MSDQPRQQTPDVLTVTAAGLAPLVELAEAYRLRQRLAEPPPERPAGDEATPQP